MSSQRGDSTADDMIKVIPLRMPLEPARQGISKYDSGRIFGLTKHLYLPTIGNIESLCSFAVTNCLTYHLEMKQNVRINDDKTNVLGAIAVSESVRRRFADLHRSITDCQSTKSAEQKQRHFVLSNFSKRIVDNKRTWKRSNQTLVFMEKISFNDDR
jgi:hypothetical protein